MSWGGGGRGRTRSPATGVGGAARPARGIHVRLSAASSLHGLAARGAVNPPSPPSIRRLRRQSAVSAVNPPAVFRLRSRRPGRAWKMHTKECMHDGSDFETGGTVRHGRRRHRCDARTMLTATLRFGPAVVGRAPGRTTAGGSVLIGPVTLTFGGHMAGAPCRFAAAVRWLRSHGAGRGDVVLRDGSTAVVVAWPCGAAARRPRATEGDALRAVLGVRGRLERAGPRARAGAASRMRRTGRR